MLSRGGKSLCKDHCAPTRSHDRRIATHRHVLYVVGVTGTVEIFIASSLLLRYISGLHRSPSPIRRVVYIQLTRDIRLRKLVAGETKPSRRRARRTLFSTSWKDLICARAVINYYVERTELSCKSSIITAIVSFCIYLVFRRKYAEEFETPVADSRQQAAIYNRHFWFIAKYVEIWWRGCASIKLPQSKNIS